LSQNEHSKDGPLSVTILTSDVSLLLDVDVESHLRGLGGFLDRVERHFQDAKFQTIRIAILRGKTVPIDASGYIPVKPDPSETDEINDAYCHRAPQVSELLKRLQEQIESKSEELFKRIRSQILFDAKMVARMDVQVFSVDSKYGYHTLLQKVSQDAVSRQPSGSSQTLRLSLPETEDFDACIVAMQASYKIMPFRLDSVLSTSLYRDLEILSRSELIALQLSPIESIDASLMYGVPISIRSGLAENTDQHRENLLILQSILKTLANKDCALFLSAKLPDDIDDHPDNYLFQESQDQMYVLLPELLGSKAGPPTFNGVIFRVALADHILKPSSGEEARQHCIDNQNGETNEYLEFVETSLDSLDCSPFNPLLMTQGKNVDENDTVSPEKKKVTWQEDCIQAHHKELEPTDTREPSNQPSAEEIWNDNSGIGMIMTEKKKHTDKSNSATLDDRNAERNAVIRKTLDVDAYLPTVDCVGTADDQNQDEEAKRDFNTKAEEDSVDTIAPGGDGADEIGSNDDDSDDDSSDDIEESEDDWSASMNATAKPKRKPTEVLPAGSQLKKSDLEDGEQEWMQEFEEEREDAEDEGYDDDSSSPFSSSSSSSDESARESPSFGKFEYS
jgi:hypothetical protein